MENREEQGLGLSPWRSATTSDEFWDRGLEDNPQFPISVAPAIDEIVDGSRQVFTPSVSNRPSSVTGPNNSSWSQLRLTRPQVKTTHTFSRPIDTTIPSSSMAPSGIRSNEFYRSRWPTNYLYPPNQTIPSFEPRGGSRGGGRTRRPPPPPKIRKHIIFLRKIVIFHTKYPRNFRASLCSAQFFMRPPNLKSWILPWNRIVCHLFGMGLVRVGMTKGLL